MGGGDSRPEDSDDGDDYEDREPDEFQVDFDSLGGSDDGDGGSSGDSGGDGGSGSEGPTTLSDFGGGADRAVDRVQQYAAVGNDGGGSSGGGSGDSDGGTTLSDYGGGSDDTETGPSTLSAFVGDEVTGSRAILALSGLGLAVGTNARGDLVVDMGETAVEDVYEAARDE